MKKEVKNLHIVCLSQPYPPIYGGAIDMFYKIKALHEAGIKLKLHIFLYGKAKRQTILQKYADEVHYYKRKIGILSQISFLPYIVKTRENEELLNNLCLDNDPILFEGLHCCFYLTHEKLRNRFKMVRLHNVEHNYYKKLAKASKWGVSKLFFFIESFRLKKYEKCLKCANRLLPISIADEEYYKKLLPNNDVSLVNCFFDDNPWNECCQTKRAIPGTYVLYHGNLSVAENVKVVEYILKNIAPSLIDCTNIVIAGQNPSESLKKEIKAYQKVMLISNPSMDMMNNIIHFAHVILLLTFQRTGVKLKLLNTLGKSQGFCIVNNQMLYGINLSDLCVVGNSDTEIINLIKEFINKKPEKDIIQRRLNYIKKNRFNDISSIISVQ